MSDDSMSKSCSAKQSAERIPKFVGIIYQMIEVIIIRVSLVANLFIGSTISRIRWLERRRLRYVD